MNKCSSSTTLRQKLEAAKGGFDTILKEESTEAVNNTAVVITGVLATKDKLILLDDVTLFDN